MINGLQKSLKPSQRALRRVFAIQINIGTDSLLYFGAGGLCRLIIARMSNIRLPAMPIVKHTEAIKVQGNYRKKL